MSTFTVWFERIREYLLIAFIVDDGKMTAYLAHSTDLSIEGEYFLLEGKVTGRHDKVTWYGAGENVKQQVKAFKEAANEQGRDFNIEKTQFAKRVTPGKTF